MAAIDEQVVLLLFGLFHAKAIKSKWPALKPMPN
jgi:hypothetical protein